MKTKLFKVASSLAVVMGTAVGFTSCQQENFLEPVKSSQANSQEQNHRTTEGSLRQYTLIKHGSRELQYAKTGQLLKVSANAGNYTEYSYSNGGIESKRYENDKLVEKITYSLTHGKASTADVTKYTYTPQGVSTTTSTFQYQYNNQGHLEHFRDTAWPQYYFKYQYDSEGNLVKETMYQQDSGGGIFRPFQEMSYSYQLLSNATIDKYSLNPQFYCLDRYLNIFGTFNKHLFKEYTRKVVVEHSLETTGQLKYVYTLNQDGYVTSRKTYDVYKGDSFPLSESYHYQVNDVSVPH